jgi:hypothetical protein
LRAVASLALTLVIAQTAAAATSWSVRVDEGIAGVRLGMTERQVAARLGKPYAMSIAITHVSCGMYRRIDDFAACFDTRTHKVVSTTGIGSAFCVVRPPFCLGSVGGVRKLRQAFGRRLLGPVRRGDGVFYEVIRRVGGARVQNAFQVDTVNEPPLRGSSVIAAYIGFCGRQGRNVPACPRPR